MLILNLLISSMSPTHLILWYMVYIYNNCFIVLDCILSPVPFPGQFCLLNFFPNYWLYIPTSLCTWWYVIGRQTSWYCDFCLDKTCPEPMHSLFFFPQYISILKPCFVMNIKVLRNKILSVFGFKLHPLGLEQHEPWLTSLYFWVLSLMPYEW